MSDKAHTAASEPRHIVQDFASNDYQRWLPLWQSYQRFYNVTLSDETTKITWQRLLDENEPVWGALITEGNSAIGFVHWIYHRSCWTIGNYCYLQDLFVHSVARGRGHGRSLIGHVEKQARSSGCSRVYWLTHETNAQAMHLYDSIAEKSGFIQYRKAF